MTSDSKAIPNPEMITSSIHHGNEKALFQEKTPSFCCHQIFKKRDAQTIYSIIKYLALLSLLFWASYGLFYRSLWVLASARSIINDGEVDEINEIDSSLVHWDQSLRIMDLPSEYMPRTGKMADYRRLIVVGDVHGMKHSLEHLLDKVGFNGTRDHLILVGDLVSKGPDSVGVVDLAMSLGATCVLGNHEDLVIQAWDDMQANRISSCDNTRVNEARNSHKPEDLALAKALGKNRIEWIKTWPMILRLEKLGAMGEVIIVHGGLDPKIELKYQNPFLVMNMRSFRHGVFTEKHKGKNWAKVRTSIPFSYDLKTKTHVFFPSEMEQTTEILTQG